MNSQIVENSMTLPVHTYFLPSNFRDEYFFEEKNYTGGNYIKQLHSVP